MLQRHQANGKPYTPNKHTRLQIAAMAVAIDNPLWSRPLEVVVGLNQLPFVFVIARVICAIRKAINEVGVPSLDRAIPSHQPNRFNAAAGKEELTSDDSAFKRVPPPGTQCSSKELIPEDLDATHATRINRHVISHILPHHINRRPGEPPHISRTYGKLLRTTTQTPNIISNPLV